MNPKKGSVRNKLPLYILLAGTGIALFGLLAIFDASIVEGFRDFNDKFHFVKQQAIWLVIGIVAATTVAYIPVSLFKKFAGAFFIFCLFLMVLVLIPGVGSKFLGARRWIVLGPIVIQPSELIKISLIIYLSHWLEVPRSLKQFLVLLGLNLGLIMLQPDLGTAIIVIGSCFAIYYLSGANTKDILIFLSILACSMVVLIASSPYRMDRLKTFLDPTSDPLGASYHINQVLYGLGSGGMSGVGLGKSRQKFAFLPEATTDSIFVIIAEEFGFLGSSMLIFIFVGLTLLSFKVALSLPDKFEKLMASGISLMFLIQIFVNLGSMAALIPLTGVPLPFISYGGSSLVTNFIALGLLVNLARKA